jgi:hypothetical protein
MSQYSDFQMGKAVDAIQDFNDSINKSRDSAAQKASTGGAGSFEERVSAAHAANASQAQTIAEKKDATNFFGYKAPEKGQDPFGLGKNASVGNLWEIKPAGAHGGTVWGGGGSIWGSEQSTNNAWGGGSIHGPQHEVTDIHGNVVTNNDHWCSASGGVNGWGTSSTSSNTSVYGNSSGFWGGGSDDSNGSWW